MCLLHSSLRAGPELDSSLGHLGLRRVLGPEQCGCYLRPLEAPLGALLGPPRGLGSLTALPLLQRGQESSGSEGSLALSAHGPLEALSTGLAPIAAPCSLERQEIQHVWGGSLST